MRVLVACEFSGIVRDAFIARGHDAISCDLLESERPGPHYQGDIFEYLNHDADVRDLVGGQGFDLMIAHPPCTHLAVSGAAWFKYKRQEQADALDFVRRLLALPIPRIALEILSALSVRTSVSRIKSYQPWQFGDAT